MSTLNATGNNQTLTISSSQKTTPFTVNTNGYNNITVGLGASTASDVFNVSGGSGDKVTPGSGNDIFNLSNDTATVVYAGNGNDQYNISNSTNAVVNLGTGNDKIAITDNTTGLTINNFNAAKDVLTENANDTGASSYAVNLTTASSTATQATYTADASLVGQVTVNAHGNNVNLTNAGANANGYTGDFTVSNAGSSVAVTLTGSTVDGGDQLIAGNGNDTLIGNQQDTLVAGSGSDSLVSAQGSNTLVGGSGADVFVVGSASNISDATITGLNTTETLQVYSGSSAAVTLNGAWVAPSNSLIDGAVTINANGNSALATLAAGGGGVDITDASANSVVLAGLTASSSTSTLDVSNASGADLLIADGGANVLDGSQKVLTDTFAVIGTGTSATINNVAGSEALLVGSGDTALVNLAGAWTATSASEVDGSVTLNTDGNVNTAALTGGGAITVNIQDGIDVTGSGTVVTLSNAETYDVIGDQNAGNYANITGDSVVGYFANDTVQGATSYVSDPSGNGAILSTSGTDLYDTAGDYWFVGDPNAPVGAAATNPLNNVLEVGAGNALAGATDSNIFNIQTVQSTATGVSVNVQHLSSDLTLDAGIGSDTVTAGTGSDTVLAGKSDVIGLGNQGANNDTVVFGASGTGGTASGSTVTISGLHVGDVVSDSAANLVTGGEHAAGKSGSTSWAGIDSHGNVTAWQGSVTTTSAAVTEIINSFRETGGVTQGDYSFFNLSGKEYLYIAGTTGETTSGSSDSLIQLTGVSTTETHSVSGGALTLTHL